MTVYLPRAANDSDDGLVAARQAVRRAALAGVVFIVAGVLAHLLLPAGPLRVWLDVGAASLAGLAGLGADALALSLRRLRAGPPFATLPGASRARLAQRAALRRFAYRTWVGGTLVGAGGIVFAATLDDPWLAFGVKVALTNCTAWFVAAAAAHLVEDGMRLDDVDAEVVQAARASAIGMTRPGRQRLFDPGVSSPTSPAGDRR